LNWKNNELFVLHRLIPNNMKFISGLMIFFLLFQLQINIFGQQEEHLRTYFEDAEYFLMSEDYNEALNAYQKLNNENPENANINYRIGLCYLNIPGQKTKAIPFLEKAVKNISEKYFESTFNETTAPVQSLFLLATAYQINNDFDLARSTFNEYKTHLKVNDVYEIDFVDKQIESCNTAEQLMKEPINIKSTILEDIVPQIRPNFNPVLSANGLVMVFATEERFYDAVWMIQKANNRWGNPVNISPQIGSDGDTYPCSLSPDGKTLYLVRTNNYGSNIYVSNFEGMVWSPMRKLSKPVNSKYFESHACISPDGKTLYFSSNRKGGIGSQDIYKSELDSRGNWGEAINLGPEINTIYNEITPFLAKDGKVLYFASQGHKGMGGFDSYRSVIQNDGSYSQPVNLGYPINSTDDNMFVYPVEDNKKFLYAGDINEESKKASIKEIEIVPFLLVKNIVLKGNVVALDNPAELDSSITVEIINLRDNNVIGIFKPDPKTGNFQSSLPSGDFELVASGPTYKASKKNLNIPEDFERSEISVNLQLTPIEVSSGEYVVIKNIFFAYDSYKLEQDALLEIERLYQVMIKYPDLFVEVIGHTDSRGTAKYNLELSDKRVHAIINYLNTKGIAKTRFVSRALGESKDIARNINPDGTDNPEGRRLNRSAEIKILQPDNFNIVVEAMKVPDYLKPSLSGTYTILLTSSSTPLSSNKFGDFKSITEDDVHEEFSGSAYHYTLGRFYSRIHAMEILKSIALNDYPNAKVVNLNELPQYSNSSALFNSESIGKLYGIQLYALKQPTDMSEFKNLDNVTMIKCSDGLYRIVYGKFTTKEEAVSELPELSLKGFKDVFVIDYSMIPVENEENLNQSAQEDVFTIQLKALKTPVGKSYFRNLREVREITGDDGIFRYVYGEYTNIDNAKYELDRVRNLGYEDAFLKNTKTLFGY
jgi:outer membrane protein OmpA-like peptidoglycan-associated protein